MEKKTETTIVYWGYRGIMEKKTGTTIVYWGYRGIREKKMDTTMHNCYVAVGVSKLSLSLTAPCSLHGLVSVNLTIPDTSRSMA